MDGTYFPVIELTGNAYERGMKHGTLLKMRIHQTIKFYKKYFKLSEEEILSIAEHFQSIIAEVNKDYIFEMEGIAEGADVDFRWILALNSRSEILTMVNQNVSECTALVVPDSGLLAQNWDWAEELEKLSVIMKIQYENGHQILMITEPGIIGKIGFNSKGVRVTLNFLHAPGKLDGLPIHIMLRTILDSESYNQALEITRNYAKGKAGNIIIANNQQYTDFEFANTEYYELPSSDNKPFTHTNHFLGNEILNSKRDLLASSFARHKRSVEMVNQSSLQLSEVENIKAFLKDQENSNLPICRPYVVDEEIGNVGTVCSIIMDLNDLIMHYTPGNPFENDYLQIKLERSNNSNDTPN